MALAGWVLSAPQPVETLSAYSPDAENGRTVFLIGGCASCHAAKGAKDDARLVLAGGQGFESPFGTFLAPNISSDPKAGIGAWTELQFVSAMQRGVSPDGRHYYPAFPYTSYARMSQDDVRDLWAYLGTLPQSDRANEAHDVGFPFNITRGIGLWKQLHLTEGSVIATPSQDPIWIRGRYLVEGAGHCAECHTPRDFGGGLVLSQWLAGAALPVGKGRVPGLTAENAEFAAWSVADIAEYLQSGFTPDYDSAGGEMVSVIANTAQLAQEDRLAIATYLKSLK